MPQVDSNAVARCCERKSPDIYCQCSSQRKYIVSPTSPPRGLDTSRRHVDPTLNFLRTYGVFSKHALGAIKLVARTSTSSLSMGFDFKGTLEKMSDPRYARVRHILVEEKGEEGRSKLEEAKEEIAGDLDKFSEVAEKMSTCTSAVSRAVISAAERCWILCWVMEPPYAPCQIGGRARCCVGPAEPYRSCSISEPQTEGSVVISTHVCGGGLYLLAWVTSPQHPSSTIPSCHIGVDD